MGIVKRVLTRDDQLQRSTLCQTAAPNVAKKLRILNLVYPVCCQYDESVIICRSGASAAFQQRFPDFQRVFPDDAACAAYLERLRWPDGFTCPKCKKLDEPYRFAKRTSVVLRCRACHVNTSLTATTVMQSSHMPLSVWFWGAYLVTTQTPDNRHFSSKDSSASSAMKRRSRCFTNYAPVLCVRSVIRLAISTQFEVDKSFVGGRTKGEGRGVHHKAIVIGAIEVRPERLPLEGARQDILCWSITVTIWRHWVTCINLW